MNKLIAFGVAGLIGLGTLNAGPAAASDHEVVFGFAASYSGWMAAYSQPPTNAANPNGRGAAPANPAGDRRPLDPETLAEAFRGSRPAGHRPT